MPLSAGTNANTTSTKTTEKQTLKSELSRRLRGVHAAQRVERSSAALCTCREEQGSMQGSGAGVIPLAVQMVCSAPHSGPSVLQGKSPHGGEELVGL